MSKAKTVLITGVTGTVGKVLANGLKDRYQLRGLARRPECPVQDIQYFQGDITVKESLIEPLSGVDTVIHLAGDANVSAEWESLMKNNINGTYNIFETAHQAGVKRVIFASTNHVTGIYYEKRSPMDTKMPPRPDSLYGVSKITGEALGRFYADRFGLSVICLRIGWTNTSDDPRKMGDLARLWLSHRDLIDLVYKSIEVTDLPYAIFYGVSDNTASLWDIENAQAIIGYEPQDNCADHVDIGEII